MEKSFVVYRDENYILGSEDGSPFIVIKGKKYTLSCHPYEPCLYVAYNDGGMTAVHNSFDPYHLLSVFSEGGTVTSITGMEYDALDFCRMVEYAAGKVDIQIDDAEKVFLRREKKKYPDKKEKKEKAVYGENSPLPERDKIIENDPFYEMPEKYPDCVIDYCLIKNEHSAVGYNAHRHALLLASGKLFLDENGEAIWRYDVGKADAKRISANELFAPVAEGEKLNYRKAFLCPPYPCDYTDADFEIINALLFPSGKDGLEVYEWTTDWSEYFDEGREWWGTLCLTVYDKALDRFAVIMASASD